MIKVFFVKIQEIITGFPIAIENRLHIRLKRPTLPDLRILYIGGYWRGPNDVVAMMLRGLQAVGVNIYEFNTDEHPSALESEHIPYDRGTSGPVWLVWSELLPHIVKSHPQIIVCNAGGLSFRPQQVRILRRWGIKLLGISLSDPEVYEPTTSKICHNFDVFYTLAEDYVDRYQQKGVRSYLLRKATSEQFFRPVPARPEYECDVLVLGAVHEDRIEPVKKLVEHFNTHVYGENWEKYGIENRGFLFGEDSLSALNSAKMTVIFPKTISGYKAVKIGIFDFLAAGCLVVTEDIPALHDYFKAGKEVIAFSNEEDMLAKIRFYLDHPDQAEAIRRAGRKKVIENYTWKNIWPDILETVMAS